MEEQKEEVEVEKKKRKTTTTCLAYFAIPPQVKRSKYSRNVTGLIHKSF